MILTASPKLSDQPRCSNLPKAAEYEGILRKTPSLLYQPEFGVIIIRQLGIKEETTVASTIVLMRKGTRHPHRQQYIRTARGGRGSGWRSARRNLSGPTCFNCNKPGHFQRPFKSKLPF